MHQASIVNAAGMHGVLGGGRTICVGVQGWERTLPTHYLTRGVQCDKTSSKPRQASANLKEYLQVFWRSAYAFYCACVCCNHSCVLQSKDGMHSRKTNASGRCVCRAHCNAHSRHFNTTSPAIQQALQAEYSIISKWQQRCSKVYYCSVSTAVETSVN